jgi:hypothetical protein
VPATIGLLQQASNLAQFAGPVVLGMWIERFGWSAAPTIVASAALAGIAASFVLREATPRRSQAASSLSPRSKRTERDADSDLAQQWLTRFCSWKECNQALHP